MTAQGRCTWQAVVAAVLLLTVVGCGSSAGGAGDVSTTTTVAAAPAPTAPGTAEKVFMPCSEAVILGEVFDEEMVTECMLISGIESATCDDGAVIGLIDISGTPLVVRAGVGAESVDDTVAKKLNDVPPVRYDIDQAKLRDRCT